MSNTVYGPGGIVGCIPNDLQKLNEAIQRQSESIGIGGNKPMADARNRLNKLAKVIADHASAEDCEAAANALRPYAARAMEKL